LAVASLNRFGSLIDERRCVVQRIGWDRWRSAPLFSPNGSAKTQAESNRATKKLELLTFPPLVFPG